jgi:protein TonB
MPDQTILLIDFDPRSIEQALRSLTDAGYHVEVANDGQTGLEAFNKLHPDLVLIEPMVPRKHGFEVCKEIKESAEGSGTPVLITTGFYTGRKHHSQAKQLYRCDDYLEKPLNGEKLLSACRRFLDRQEPVIDRVSTNEEIDAAAWEEPIDETEIEAALGERRSDESPVEDGGEFPVLDALTEAEIVAHLDALIVGPPAAEEAEKSTVVEQVEQASEEQAHPAPNREQSGEPDSEEALPADFRSGPAKPEVTLPEPAAEPMAPDPAVSEPRALPASAPENGVRAAGAEPRSRKKAGKGRLLLLSALAIVLIAGGAFTALRLSEVGDVAPEPVRAVAGPDIAPPARPEPDNRLSTISDGVVPVEAILPEVVQGPVQDPEPLAGASEPARQSEQPSELMEQPAAARNEPPPRIAQKPRVPKPRQKLLPAVEFTELEPAPEPASLPKAIVPEEGAVIELNQEPAAPPEPKARPGELIDLAEVDSAPVPLEKELPAYSSIARRLRQEGTVVLRLLVNDQGNVEQVEVLSNSAGNILGKSAVEQAKRWSYRPAMKDDVAVRVWILEKVSFKL